MKIFNDFSLQSIHTFRFDHKCSKMIVVESESDLNQIPNDLGKFMVIGSGSNMLLHKDYDYCFIKMEIPGIEVVKISQDNTIILEVGAGVIWDILVDWAVKKGYSGIENLSLIPGTCGAAPVQNIGAYGVELSDVFESLRAYNVVSQQFKEFSKNDMNFRYRHSIFKDELKKNWIISKIKLRLSADKFEPKINYQDLKNYFTTQNITSATLSQTRNAIISIRQSKLPDPSQIPNCGSFFKNPIVDESFYQSLFAKFPAIKSFALIDNKRKIPAAWLIESCDLKGITMPSGVGIYEKHALILINLSAQKGDAMVQFSQYIQSEVLNKFGIYLEPEVNFID